MYHIVAVPHCIVAAPTVAACYFCRPKWRASSLLLKVENVTSELWANRRRWRQSKLLFISLKLFLSDFVNSFDAFELLHHRPIDMTFAKNPSRYGWDGCSLSHAFIKWFFISTLYYLYVRYGRTRAPFVSCVHWWTERRTERQRKSSEVYCFVAI